MPRRRRHGRGLPRRRYAPGPDGRAQVPEESQQRRRLAADAAAARGPRRLVAALLQHRRHLRRRRTRRHDLHRDGVRRRRADRGADCPRPASGARRGADRDAGGGRAGRGARARRHPPRHQERQPDRRPARARQAARLRPRQARAGRRCARRDDPDGRARDGRRHRDGHVRLHVAGAGARTDGGLPFRPVLARRRAVRNAGGAAAVRGRHDHRGDRRRHQPRAAGAGALQLQHPGRARARRPEAARQGSGLSLSVGARALYRPERDRAGARSPVASAFARPADAVGILAGPVAAAAAVSPDAISDGAVRPGRGVGLLFRTMFRHTTAARKRRMAAGRERPLARPRAREQRPAARRGRPAGARAGAPCRTTARSR